MRGVEGGIVAKTAPINISNVAIFNPETKKADRVGIKLVETERKVKRVRVFKSNGAQIDA
jgi:large subunit ribosomal protein L24